MTLPSCEQLKNGVEPVADWFLDVPYMYMDAEPEPESKDSTRCDGNSQISVSIKIGENDHVFSRRFLWMSRLQGQNFNVYFQEHPEYEWNEQDDLSAVDLEVFEYIKTHHKELLMPIYADISAEYGEAFKEQHLSCFEGG